MSPWTPERRSRPRHSTYLEGRIADKDAQVPLACTVWDLSETGVRLVIPAPAEVPLEFELQIPAEDARARVRLVWNTGTHYGARFVD
jgi:hypothetical protein